MNGRSVRALVAAAALAGAGAPAVRAAPEDIALLQSYVGTWAGEGVARNSDGPQFFNCKLGVRRGNGGKIIFSGSCRLGVAAISVAGTIAYVERLHHFEAALSSSTDFSGAAVGERTGPDLAFALKDRDTDSKGNDLALKAEMVFQSDAIAISFGAILNGEPWNGAIGFRR